MAPTSDFVLRGTELNFKRITMQAIHEIPEVPTMEQIITVRMLRLPGRWPLSRELD
jgi:hypothetical protein